MHQVQPVHREAHLEELHDQQLVRSPLMLGHCTWGRKGWMEAAGALFCSGLCTGFHTLSSFDLDPIVDSCIYASRCHVAFLTFSKPTTLLMNVNKTKQHNKNPSYSFQGFVFLPLYLPPTPIWALLSGIKKISHLEAGHCPRQKSPLGPPVACKGGQKMLPQAG